jgi:hypothetical protein
MALVNLAIVAGFAPAPVKVIGMLIETAFPLTEHVAKSPSGSRKPVGLLPT